MVKKIWLCLICFLIISFWLCSFAINNLDFKGFIADEANILSKDVKTNLNMTLWDLQKKSGADIAVVILPSLNGRTVENVAIDIGRSYKIGSKRKNNGVVFLTALNEHKMRIEIGTGLENKIKISDLNEIRDYDIIPYYKEGDYEKGISRGTYRLADLVAEAEGVGISIQGTCPPRNCCRTRSSKDMPWWCYVLALILAPFSSRKRRGGMSSFGGFGGGGGFGGCGCSGSW